MYSPTQDCSTGVLGTETWSSARVAWTLNCWTIFPASNSAFITGGMGNTGLPLQNWNFSLTPAVTPEVVKGAAVWCCRGDKVKVRSPNCFYVILYHPWKKNERCLSDWHGSQPKFEGLSPVREFAVIQFGIGKYHVWSHGKAWDKKADFHKLSFALHMSSVAHVHPPTHTCKRSDVTSSDPGLPLC